MGLRVLIVGSGGREHALAWKLAREREVERIAVVPGSTAISGLDAAVRLDVDPLDAGAVARAARAYAVDLVVVGPEAPLAAGLADTLADQGHVVFGPTLAAARLESSKAFCHEVADRAGVPMARARSFAGGEAEAALDWIRELDRAGSRSVLKADGLAAGKGVVVTDSPEQALELAPRFVANRPADAPALVVEERLEGLEASVIAICDGSRAVALPAARDHKRLWDGETGPNTGGMGAYSPLPDLDDDAVEEIVETVHRPILGEMARRGTPFIGFLYAGLILTSRGPRLLECNVRLGDPEAQVILPRLASDLAPLLHAAARRALPSGTPTLLPTTGDATVGIVLAAGGYPGNPRRGDPIEGLDEASRLGALIFHAGTVGRPHAAPATNGGRVLTVVGRGPSLPEARIQAERAADAISWDGMQRRHDIARELPEPAAAVGSPA